MIEVEILKKYWGYDTFRPLQQDIVRSVLEGRHTLALMPTGGGKSICFQVPAMVMEGVCIVVSPLIALMKDQVEGLKDKGIEAVAIYAGMGKREIDIVLDNCIYGKTKFLYLSPERLLSPLVKERIAYMNVNLIAIDEAHCISQWGYDFRPPYLQIQKLKEIHPKVPVLALTATATNFVRNDILEKLEITDAQVFVKSFARDNLSYVVFDIEDKHKKLINIVQNVKGSGLVYVRNRRETAEIAAFLQRNQIYADFYHAGLTKEDRFKKQENWKLNKTRVMVATNAFGMGIDKPDVRFVIHLDLPESLEAYYQEAGRAGRDEKRAYAILLTNHADQQILKAKYADNFPTVDEIKNVYHALGNFYQLAYGAGEGLSFDFDLISFCKRFNFSLNKTLAALKFLERDGYITLSESISLPSRILFTLGNEDLYRFQIENSFYDPLIKTIQRSYGGTFDSYAKINENELAKRLGLSFNEVVKLLNDLNQRNVLSYIPQTDKPQLQYVLARQELSRLTIDAKYINLRKEIQDNQVKSVLTYAKNSICRNIQLLNYFSENNAQKCGICDVCLAETKHKITQELLCKIDESIQTILSNQKLKLEELLAQISIGTEEQKITQIRELIDAGKIRTEGDFYFLG